MQYVSSDPGKLVQDCELASSKWQEKIPRTCYWAGLVFIPYGEAGVFADVFELGVIRWLSERRGERAGLRAG
jgi:hypothetical protein